MMDYEPSEIIFVISAHIVIRYFHSTDRLVYLYDKRSTNLARGIQLQKTKIEERLEILLFVAM